MMALGCGNSWLRSSFQLFKSGKLNIQFLRNRSFMQKKLVTREECLKMSRTSKSDYQSILTKMKLNEQWPGFQGLSTDLQLLRSNCSTLEHLYIRPGNSFVAYHRMELIMQRLKFMSKMGLSSKEKLYIIKRNPPLLLLVKKQFCDSSEMVYLRGVLKEGSTSKYLFYPIFPRTCAKKTVLDNRLDELANSIAITREQMLNIIMSLPCISINSNSLTEYREKAILVHMKMLPRKFDMDIHTLDIYPPIYSQKVQYPKIDFFQWQNESPNFKEIKLSDILETTYNISNGPGCPEDLAEFLLRSHCEERQYLKPVNFKQKKMPRKHRRFSNMTAFKSLLYS